MQVSVEATGNIERKLSIVVPVERIDEEVNKRLKSMRSRVRIDGFRPGKVPMSIVSQQYGDAAFQEVVGDLFQSTFYEAADQEKLKVAGLPQIEPQTLEPGKDLEYTATFDTYPEFEIADISEMEVKQPAVKVTAADIDEMIETLRKQSKDWKEVDRAAKVGDLLSVDFVGTIDGETFEGGSAEGFSVELGAGRMLKDFEDALIGMKAGDEKDSEVSFPEDYPAEKLKGKTSLFNIKVNKVSEPLLPEVDEEFIKNFGVDDGSIDSFKEEVKSNMERELEQRVKGRVKQAVMEGLEKLHKIDLPKSLVANEIKQLRNEMSQNAEGADLSTLPDDIFKDQAERRVKLGLIVGEIITKNKLEKDQQRVDDMLNSLAASYEDPQALIEYYRGDQAAMQTIEAAVMEEMIVEWALEKAKVVDEEMKFSDLVGPETEVAA